MFLLSFVTVVALGEVLLRAYHKVRPVAYFTEDKLLKYRGKPHEKVMGYQLNSRGFKDREHSLEKPAGTYRIAAVGDSFAFGSVPYPANYLTLLEEYLNRDGMQSFEVIDMGIVGTEPPEYFRLVRDEALLYEPDMVLVSLFTGNDFYLKLEKNMSPKKPLSFLYTFLHNTFRVLGAVDVLEARRGGSSISRRWCQ
ncbi:hypothetical protein LCGC14_2272980, partial [marine sediment metagenome]